MNLTKRLSIIVLNELLKENYITTLSIYTYCIKASCNFIMITIKILHFKLITYAPITYRFPTRLLHSCNFTFETDRP